MTQPKAKKGGRPGPAARSAARLGAVQALYQMDIAGTAVVDILEEFQRHRLGVELDGDTYEDADVALFNDIVKGVVGRQVELDRAVNALVPDDWQLPRLDATLRAVLRAAAYELVARKDVPAKVVINEYLDVAKAFFDGQETAFANGVLDTLARSVRSGELSPPDGQGA